MMGSHALFSLISSGFVHTKGPISQNVSHLNLNEQNVLYSFDHEWSTMRSHVLSNLISSVFLHTKRPISQDVSHLNLNRKTYSTPFIIWFMTMWLLHCYNYSTLIDTVILPSQLLLVIWYKAVAMLNFPSPINSYVIPLAPPINHSVSNPPDTHLCNSLSSSPKMLF